MRCIGCGHEMHLVKAVADCTMMVPGYEHQTLECPGCRTVERRMVFGRTIGPLTVEPMRLSSDALACAADPKQNDRVGPSKTYSEKTYSEKTHSEKTWARALDRLRSTQSALKERAAAAMAAKTIHELYRTWDGLMPGRRTEVEDRSSAGTPSGSRQKPRGTSERAVASEAPKPAATRLATAQRPTVSHRPTAASMSGKVEPGARPR